MVKPFWILLKQETMGDSGVSWSKLPLAPKTTTPVPHHSGFYSWMPFLLPNQQRQSTEGAQLIKLVRLS